MFECNVENPRHKMIKLFNKNSLLHIVILNKLYDLIIRFSFIKTDFDFLLFLL